MDVQEIDGASHTSVDNIREINENIKYPPVGAPHKIIIIDEVHMISINAFNALLKTLEEPPRHAKFIFATTESHKVPATIKSRCQTFAFRTVPIREMIDGTARILKQEGLEATEQALALIAREAQGSFRDALSLLDQVASFGDGHITEELIRENLGVAGHDCYGHMVAMVRDRKPAEALSLLHELCRQGYDPEQFVLDMIRYMRNLIVVKAVPPQMRAEGMIDAAPAELDEMEQLAQTGSVHEFQNMAGMLLRGESELKRTGNPWVALEMTVLRMTFAPELVDLSELVRRMDSAPSVPTPEPPPAPRPARKPVVPKRSRAADNESPTQTVTEDPVAPEGRFVIEKAIPLPQGDPAEVWIELKERIRVECQDHALASIMDHGTLIAFGTGGVEIGFNKSFYQEQFDERLQTKPAVRQVFDDLFGKAPIKVLTLAEETTLKTENHYPQPIDGQTDRSRALIHEARENPIVRAVLEEFEDSSIEDIRLITPKH